MSLLKTLSSCALLTALVLWSTPSSQALRPPDEVAPGCGASFTRVSSEGYRPRGSILYVTPDINLGSAQAGDSPDACSVSFSFGFHTPGFGVAYNNCGLLGDGDRLETGLLYGHLREICGGTRQISFQLGLLNPEYKGHCPPRPLASPLAYSEVWELRCHPQR
jgi:hypothetical protein